MNILIVKNGLIPFIHYGGTERIIWYLGKELVRMGHKITYLVHKGSHCDFAKVLFIDPEKPIYNQIPNEFDLVHFHYIPAALDKMQLPYLVTLHGNHPHDSSLDNNTVFISHNHAQRHGSEHFVYNGLDWSDYQLPDFKRKRTYFHFLAKAAWRVKNVKGAIDVIKKSQNEKIKILGGHRLNVSMGFRWTLTHKAQFYGMVGGEQKHQLLKHSKGLIFPVRWHEPFGLAIIESLYYGCPVFGTPYGSLPELIPTEVGYLTNDAKMMAMAIKNAVDYNAEYCHSYARDTFNVHSMAAQYLEYYQKIVLGIQLHKTNPNLKATLKEKFLPWYT